MATQINGAIVTQNGYEFGYSVEGGEVKECASYSEAVAKMAKWWPNAELKMRCRYITEWVNAQ